MENLDLYNKVREVPDNAKKSITGGRLNGMTDINPMWRIKTLTEQFGVCGIGWKPKIVREWLDNGANGEIIANVEIELYVKVDGQWSDAIPGVGGSKFVAKESGGVYTDDECYKKAYRGRIIKKIDNLQMFDNYIAEQKNQPMEGKDNDKQQIDDEHTA